MKVCMLTSVHRAFDHRIFHKEARSLVRAGYEVFLVVPHERDEEVEGVQVLRVLGSRSRLRRMLLVTIRVLLRGLKVRAPIYHFHDPELIPAGLFLRLLGKKVIYDIHEFNADSVLGKYWIPSALRWLVSRAVMWLDGYAVSRMSGIIVDHDEKAEFFRPWLRSRRSVVTVHNYPELAEIARDNWHSGDEPVAIYVGGLWKDRGLEVLLQAGERLKRAYSEARVQVLGPLELDGIDPQYAFVDRWGAYGVEYLGTVGHRDVLKWLQRARVGLLPWLATPQYLKTTAVKLFEYMLAGLPVVASDFGVARRIISETGCGLLVAPGDPDALSAAVETLLRDPAKAAEMGQRGRTAVLDRYNWGSEEKKLVALYESLVGHP